MALSSEEIEAIAAAIERRLEVRQSRRLVDAAGLAEVLGVERDWVYRNAARLGGIRLGGRSGRLRFDVEATLRLLAASPLPSPSCRSRAAPRRRRRRGGHQESNGLELIDYES